MNREEFQPFVYDTVDDILAAVFFRFPDDAAKRAEIYRYISDMILEIADDLDRDAF